MVMHQSLSSFEDDYSWRRAIYDQISWSSRNTFFSGHFSDWGRGQWMSS